MSKLDAVIQDLVIANRIIFISPASPGAREYWANKVGCGHVLSPPSAGNTNAPRA
jgi:hypothetical protein